MPRCAVVAGAIPQSMVLAILFVGLTAPSAVGAGGSESEPKNVHVGVYLKHLHGISLKDSKVVVDFHLWFRWTDDALKPLDTFELINGTIESKQNAYDAVVEGQHYASCRVLATLYKVWDVTRYPIDAHVITVEIEDSEREAHKLVYVPDVDNSGLAPHADAAGWVLQAGTAEVLTHTDRTNYGDVSLPTGHESSWSRFVYSARIARPGFGIFLKLFTGLFVATAIAVHGVVIPPAHIDARVGLSVGAIFAAVASEYLVTSGLPDSNSLTLADQLHIVSFLLIFMTLAESVFVYKLVLRQTEALAVRIDRVCFWAFVLGYCGVVTMLIAG